MEPYTYNYLKAHADRLPALLEDFVHHDVDFRFWSGELRSVTVQPTNSDEYIAQIDIELWDDGTNAAIPLRYLIHTHHAIYPIRMGGPETFNKLWQFRMPVIKWMDTFKEADQERVKARTKVIKEDLMATVWHPDRVAKRLEEPGGLEAC